MKEKKTAEIDFDTWSEMAREDPATFESMRLAAIEAAIAGAPKANRERLRCLQWRIDQERRLSPTPMAACVRISRMMWRSVLGEGGLRDRFGELQGLFHGHARVDGLTKRSPAGRVVRFARAAD